jgi:heptosyltransferase-2
VHQVEYYQHLVRALGCPSGPSVPRVIVAPAHDEAAERELRAAGWDGRRPIVGLAPGAAYGGAKRWPPEYFAELAQALAEDDVQPVLLGGHGDVPVANEILAAAGAGVLMSVMGSDLPTLAALLARCRAIVSNDSGAMHLGAAVGVRVTAVFGSTDERVTSPAGDGHTVLSHPVWCRPCGMRECPIDHRCMRGVGVGRVTDAVRRML